MADASIYSEYLKPVKSVAEYGDEMDKRKLNALQLLTAQQAQADDQSTREAYKANFGNPDKTLNALEAAGNYRAAQALRKAQLDEKYRAAGTTHLESQSLKEKELAGKTAQETRFAAAANHAQSLGMVQTPQDVAAYIEKTMDISGIPPAQRDKARAEALQKVQDFGLEGWKEKSGQAAIPVLDRFKVEAENSRNALTNQTSRLNNADTNTTHIKTNSATIAGQALQGSLNRGQSDRNFNEGQAQKLKLAGYDPEGNVTGGGDGPFAGLVNAIGNYEQASSTALARTPPAVRSQIIQQVKEKFPEYDGAQFAVRQKTLGSFTTGKQGDAVRSFGVASSHLDTLGQLSDALNNGDIKVINKIGNYVSEQTGHPAPTNFAAAKRIVADEIVKSVTGAAGALGDRETADKTLAAANSPEQLRGVINTYKQLMDGQIHGLRGQYKAGSGRDDFDTRFNIKPSTPAKPSGLPADIADLLKKHGGK